MSHEPKPFAFHDWRKPKRSEPSACAKCGVSYTDPGAWKECAEAQKTGDA